MSVPRRGSTPNSVNEAPSDLQPTKIKIVAVGDTCVGKTAMMVTYTTMEFPTDFTPTVFDNYEDKITVDGQDYNLALWDTAGCYDYDRLRPLSYPNTDCILMCYSVSSRDSYESIIDKWYPEIRHYCPSVPIVLVATKFDLCMDDDLDCITTAEGERLKRKIGATRLVECSARKELGLQQVFLEAIRVVVKKKQRN